MTAESPRTKPWGKEFDLLRGKNFAHLQLMENSPFLDFGLQVGYLPLLGQYLIGVRLRVP